jgi:hypothetical protein
MQTHLHASKHRDGDGACRSSALFMTTAP